MNNLLDVLVCSITEYFYLLFVFLQAHRAHQITAQLGKILSNTKQQNIQ